MAACKQCGREIKWKEITKNDGSKINVPTEVDGSDHKEKIGNTWQCRKVKTDEKQQRLKTDTMFVSESLMSPKLREIHDLAVATRKRLYPESDNWNEIDKRIVDCHYEKIITHLMKE